MNTRRVVLPHLRTCPLFASLSSPSSKSLYSSRFYASTNKNDSNNRKLLVTRKLPQEALDALEKGGCTIAHYWDDPSTPIPRNNLLDWVRDVDGLYCLLTDKVDVELLSNASKLKVVSSMSVGVDHIDVAACAARKIPVGHTPGVLTDSTADIAVALSLSATRRFNESINAVRNGDWATWSPFWLTSAFDVTGSTVGIVGLGRIGAAYGKRMSAGFGCKLLYSGPSPKPDVAEPLGAEYVSFDELLGRSDIVSVHCALTETTRKMFNLNVFKKMQSHAVFVNTSRGGMVDQEGLYQALKQGIIGGAGLDVTDPEPLPLSSPLLQLPNITILPHIGSSTVPTRMKMVMMAVHNVIAGVHDRPLPHQFPVPTK